MKYLAMTREAIIERTIQAIKNLPNEKVAEIGDFADFVIKKHEEQILNENIQQLASTSEAFSFLNEEPEIYSINDLKEKYNG